MLLLQGAALPPPPGPTVVTLTAKASPTTVRRSASAAHRGPKVKYVVTLANGNKDKTTSFDSTGLVVTLPAGTAFVTGRASPKSSMPGAKHNKTLATPVYDGRPTR